MAGFAHPGPWERERACRCFVTGFQSPLAVAWRDGAWAAPLLPGPAPASRGLAWGISAGTCERFLRMSDADMLRQTSTSPELEAPEYAPKMRSLLAYIRDAAK